MQYKVEQIGAVFSTKAIQDFERLLSQRDQEGFKFHSAFPVTQAGCLGLGQGGTTYLAIFVRK
jgi:hypothetical protein